MSAVLLLTNAQARSAGIRAGAAEVNDLRSGQLYGVILGGAPGSSHVDFSPATVFDTVIMRQITNGWSWAARPAVVSQNGVFAAVGVHHFPHGSVMPGANPGPTMPSKSNDRERQTVPGVWDIGGHMCMYFSDSTGGTRGMREAAAEAFGIMQYRAHNARFNINGCIYEFNRRNVGDRNFVRMSDLHYAAFGERLRVTTTGGEAEFVEFRQYFESMGWVVDFIEGMATAKRI
jgi:hypothetical protein